LPQIRLPEKFFIDDSMIIPPAQNTSNTTITRGPNIKPLPLKQGPSNSDEMNVLLKVKDNITTDDIMPAGSKILPLRSNIEAISEYVFSGIDPGFSSRAQETASGCILARENYGQGSSREHAALAPMYLGVKAVLACSFARIHRSNLINFGIIPIEIDQQAYNTLAQGDTIRVDHILDALDSKSRLLIHVARTGEDIECSLVLSKREAEILKLGGLLNLIRSKMEETHGNNN